MATAASPSPVEVPRIPPAPRFQWWSNVLPMLASHLAALGALFFDVPAEAWVLCGALWFVRMFGVTAGYHRYFSHKTFKTSRWFQFVLAVLAQSSAQKGVLWWAAHHRDHHRFSDGERDVHSPADGFWHSHIGWMLDPQTNATKSRRVRDLTRFPELRWLNRFYLLPPTALALICLFTMGWAGLFVGFFVSTVLLWHSTFTINSLSHVWGSRRYDTTDTSRNNPVLALLTLGEGWHNNHHRYMLSARQGFRWWQVDVTYYLLKLLSWFRLVWDLRPVPQDVLNEPRPQTADRRRRARPRLRSLTEGAVRDR